MEVGPCSSESWSGRHMMNLVVTWYRRHHAQFQASKFTESFQVQMTLHNIELSGWASLPHHLKLPTCLGRYRTQIPSTFLTSTT